MIAAVEASPSPQFSAADWLRSSLAFAVGLLALQYGVGAWFGMNGGAAPMALTAGAGGMLFGLVFAVLLVMVAFFARVLCGAQNPAWVGALLCSAVGVWLLAGGMRSGTMDAWLIYQQPTPGAGQGGPYIRLLPDYILLLVVALAIHMVIARRSAPSTSNGALPTPVEYRALLIQCLIAAVVLYIAMGARFGATYRGQVFLAVYLGFLLGTLAAVHFTEVRRLGVYLGGPFVLGILGLVVAGLSPKLPAPFSEVNTIPVWALARPLPIEMIALGALGVCWALKTPPIKASGGHA